MSFCPPNIVSARTERVYLSIYLFCSICSICSVCMVWYYVVSLCTSHFLFIHFPSYLSTSLLHMPYIRYAHLTLGELLKPNPTPPSLGRKKKKVGYTKNWRDTLGMYYLTIYTPVPSEDRPKSPSARKDGKKENDEGGFVFCFRLSCRVFLFQTKNHNIQHITTPLRLLTSHLCMLHAIFFIVLLSRNFYIYIIIWCTIPNYTYVKDPRGRSMCIQSTKAPAKRKGQPHQCEGCTNDIHSA